MENKPTMIVLLHTIEYDTENVILDANAEEILHDMIADEIEYHETTGDEEALELEDEEGNPLGVTVKWRIVNPWREVASKLADVLQLCQAQQNSMMRSTTDAKIAALQEYEKLKQQTDDRQG